jgi:hypothetical protein
MDEEWRARMRNRNNNDEHGGSGGSGGSGGGSGSSDGAKKMKRSPKLGSDGKPIRCSKCGKKGHLGKDCWSKPKKGKGHVAQAEEEEGALFLVSATTAAPFIPNQQDGDICDHSPADGVFTDAMEELTQGASLDLPTERVELCED